MSHASGVETARKEREIRVPLYVPVRSEPALADCWAVNLSRSGIGLVASADPSASEPIEGTRLRVEFGLPDTDTPIQAEAEVQWRGDTGPSAEGPTRLALGLRFIGLSGAHRLAVQQYFEAYRPHVILLDRVGEGPDALAARDALDACTHLHLATSGAELDELLERGDISAVVVAGDDAAQGIAWAERVAQGTLPSAVVGGGPARDLAPRVVFAAAVDPARLVPLFNRGIVFAFVERPIDRDALQETVLQACSDHGVRTEQHRVALALARALTRQHAQRTRAERSTRAQAELVFESASMHAVIESAKAVAPYKVSVLVQGETGTGKEVVAQLVHRLSDRAEAAFVVQDCGALTETLLESELFGHVKGAFTGATSTHPGLFVMADGGTILLDEIENTSPNLQAKLLRVIETGEVRPVGGSKVRRVDVRIIAASNRDLRALMEAGRFRADLYFRLTTFPIMLPPLRERAADLVPLADAFRRAAEESMGKTTAGFSASALAALRAYRWPGNVRELRNTIERAVLLCGHGHEVAFDLPLAEVPPAHVGDPGPAATLRARVAAYERALIQEALGKHDGVLRRAAQALGTSPMTLGRKARQHRLV